jgi:hypothetical protein
MLGTSCQPGCVKDTVQPGSTRVWSELLEPNAVCLSLLNLSAASSPQGSLSPFPHHISLQQCLACMNPEGNAPQAPTRFYTPKVRRFHARCDEQHTGIILTSEVCVREERSGDLANGRRDVWQTS